MITRERNQLCTRFICVVSHGHEAHKAAIQTGQKAQGLAQDAKDSAVGK